MQLKTTPVPNIIFDHYLQTLKGTELKILLVIIRQTLGWADKRALHGRKKMDWISGSQLQAKTGSSRHAISSAIEALMKYTLIEIHDEKGNHLQQAFERKGKQKLFFSISQSLQSGVDNPVDNRVYPVNIDQANVIFAQNLRKKITVLGQKMRYTKETIQN